MSTKDKVVALEVEYDKPEPIDWDIKALNHPASTYTMEQKVGIMNDYLTGKTLKQACKDWQVPYDIGRNWKTRSAWWAEETEKLRRAKQDELDVEFTNITHKAMARLHEQLDKGEPVYDKAGNVVYYQPVKAKDVAWVAAILFDKRQLLRGNATSISSKSQSLEDLETKFKEISGKLGKKDNKGE